MKESKKQRKKETQNQQKNGLIHMKNNVTLIEYFYLRKMTLIQLKKIYAHVFAFKIRTDMHDWIRLTV